MRFDHAEVRFDARVVTRSGRARPAEELRDAQLEEVLASRAGAHRGAAIAEGLGPCVARLIEQAFVGQALIPELLYVVTPERVLHVPGDALSALVIAKLPFDVPSNPIIAARSETFENSFVDYSVPEATLRFRQDFGRLIRTFYQRLTQAGKPFKVALLPVCEGCSPS